MRIAICGNVDSGKSTFVGVLTKGLLDNGRGSVRLKVFRHKHEIDTGARGRGWVWEGGGAGWSEILVVFFLHCCVDDSDSIPFPLCLCVNFLHRALPKRNRAREGIMHPPAAIFLFPPGPQGGRRRYRSS